MKLTHTPLIDDNQAHRDALQVLPGVRPDEIKAIDQWMATAQGEVKAQGMNHLLIMAYLFKKPDLLDYLVSHGVSRQPGFFNDLSGALELHRQLSHADLDDHALVGFIALLQDYADTLGDVYKHEAIRLLLPGTERSSTDDAIYREEFAHHLNLFKLVFGSNAFDDPEVGNLLLSQIKSSYRFQCRYGAAFETLIQEFPQGFQFNDDAVVADLLEDAYDSTDFFRKNPASIAALLNRIQRPASQTSLLIKLSSKFGEVVLPLIDADERFKVGSSQMYRLNEYILHNEVRGSMTLSSHRQLHESLCRKVLTHPSFETLCKVDKTLSNLHPNSFSALSLLIANQEGVNLHLQNDSYSGFCSIIEENREFTNEDRSCLDAFMRDELAFEAKRAYRSAFRNTPENPIVTMMTSLEEPERITAAIIQICYEQLLKQAKGSYPEADTPLLDAASGKSKRAGSNLANPHLQLARMAKHVVGQMDDARILAHLPKNKRFVHLMIKNDLIKDRQYVALLTPKQQEELLCRDLSL